MSEPLNDYDHKQQQPWQVLGQIRDDLKQARACLRVPPPGYDQKLQAALDHVERALARIGDGSRSEE